MDGPRSFGKYRLRKRIAVGGMAEIWLADMLGAAGVVRPVVVKQVLPELAGNPAFLRMFEDEARIAATLAHGNIAQVFDFGTEGGRPYLAMELVVGRSLDRLIDAARARGSGFAGPVAAFVAIECCKALHYAHGRHDDEGRSLGLVHRDISPQNVMISDEGQVKLVDFGLAKAATAQVKTAPGQVKGKYLYLSPEQARGDAVDGRSDLYALGAVLFEMLAGRPPRVGALAEVMPAIARGDAMLPLSELADVDPALEEIVYRALSFRPEARPATALQLQESLSQYLFGRSPRFHGEALARLMAGLRDGARGGSPDLLSPLRSTEPTPVVDPDSEPPRRTASGDPGAETEQGDAYVDDTAVAVPVVSGVAGLARRPSRLRALGVALGAGIATGLAGVGAFVLFDQSQVLVISEPTGASIWIDGRDTGLATAERGTTFAGLQAGRHEVTLKLPGHHDGTGAVTFSHLDRHSWKDQRLAIHLDPLPRSRGAEPASEPDPRAVLSPVSAAVARHEATGSQPLVLDAPTAGTPQVVRFQPEKYALHVPLTPAARLPLKASHRYQLAARGGAQLSSLSTLLVTGVYWYAPGPRGASGGRLAKGESAVVTGATQVYGFILDNFAPDNMDHEHLAPLTLLVKDLTTGGSRSLRVHPKDNCLPLGGGVGVEAQFPHSFHGQHLTLAGSVDLGSGLAPGVAFRAEKTNAWQISAAEQDGVFGWLEPGKRIQTVSSFDWVQLIVFDAGPEPHPGAYDVMVEP
jgi:serine/threonine protein kinase